MGIVCLLLWPQTRPDKLDGSVCNHLVDISRLGVLLLTQALAPTVTSLSLFAQTLDQNFLQATASAAELLKLDD